MKAVQKIVDQFNRHLFNSVINNKLIYNTCWEDPKIDRELLQINCNSKVVMLTSAGCNALDYLLDSPAAIHCVDINPAQNALLELKRALFLNSDYSVLWRMFGDGKFGDISPIYHQSLRGALSPSARRFWDAHLGYFRASATTSSFYYRGTSGAFANIIYKFLCRKGLKSDILNLLESDSLAEQQYYFDEIEPYLWNNFSRWLMQKNATLALLGVPQRQRDIIDKEVEGGLDSFIHQSLKNVFTNRPIANNYFWRVYLTGSYAHYCCPNYLKESNFEHISRALNRVDISTGSFLEYLRQNPGRYSHFVLLDHQDWLASHQPEKVEQEWTLMLQNAEPGTKILLRSAGTKREFIPDFVDRYVDFKDAQTQELHQTDRVATYGSTHLAIVNQPL